MVAVRSASDWERAARDTFSALDQPPEQVRDEQGRTHTPGDRYAEILRASQIIGATDALARAVVTLLAERGVDAEVHQVRHDPRLGPDQVMAIRTTIDGIDSVLPVHPHATSLRAYPTDTGVNLVDVEPLGVIELPAEERHDNWTSAEMFTTALTTRVNRP